MAYRFIPGLDGEIGFVGGGGGAANVLCYNALRDGFSQ